MSLYPQIIALLEELSASFPIECTLIRADLEIFALPNLIDDERIFEEQKRELFRLIDLNIVRVRQAAVAIKRQLPGLGIEDTTFSFYPEQVDEDSTFALDLDQIESADIVVSERAVEDIAKFRTAISSYIQSMRYEPPSPGDDPSTDGNPPTIPLPKR